MELKVETWRKREGTCERVIDREMQGKFGDNGEEGGGESFLVAGTPVSLAENM